MTKDGEQEWKRPNTKKNYDKNVQKKKHHTFSNNFSNTYYFGCLEHLDDPDSYEINMHKIATFSTMTDFASCFNHILKPIDIPLNSYLYLFKENIRPMYEDEANAHGGKLSLLVSSEFSTFIWERLVFSMVSDLLDNGSEVNGIIAQKKINSEGESLNKFSIWLNSNDAAERVFHSMISALNLPNSTTVSFINHPTNPNIKKESFHVRSKPRHKKRYYREGRQVRHSRYNPIPSDTKDSDVIEPVTESS
mmetsp:Transcript_10733/g.15699  ORF Transcript_10733/g.15699 Transcript_10733/m.15699 type:complete len:249 (+) Transcript_10733:25-771(+)